MDTGASLTSLTTSLDAVIQNLHVQSPWLAPVVAGFMIGARFVSLTIKNIKNKNEEIANVKEENKHLREQIEQLKAQIEKIESRPTEGLNTGRSSFTALFKKFM